MGYTARLNRSFKEVPRLLLSEQSRYILMSDCHRGNGTSNDNFLKNRNLYYAALEYYDQKEYTISFHPSVASRQITQSLFSVIAPS